MNWTRRHFLGAGAATLAAPALASASATFDIDYLESRVEAGVLHESQHFIPPSQVHEAYSHVIYANTSFYGEARQKMWVLRRAGAAWDVALRDDDYRDREAAEAAYSWPMSSGALHQGNPRAGPTPSGIFNIDERSERYRGGWGSPGMYKAMYIDLHYNSGRRSGVAMHGTTSGRYRYFGRPASNGCLRVSQRNMDALHGLFHPGGARREDSPLWGEVPRYFTSDVADTMDARRGYVRDGTLLYDDDGVLRTKMGYTGLLIFFRDDF